MDMDDTDGSMDMSMTMTFGSWSDYDLKIVWDAWDVKTKGQFALSWFAVLFLTISYQAIKYWYASLETRMIALCLKRNGSGDLSAMQVDKASSDLSTPISGLKSTAYEALLDNVVGGNCDIPFKYIILHAAVASLNYALALILMLVAMTYNPSLFMALVVGYFLGDLLFFRRHLAPKLTNYDAIKSYQAAAGDCH